MTADEKYMLRCIELARKGAGKVAPNPMVGAVIVYNDKIIGEGYHEQYGENHAEVNAINAVKDKSLLAKSTMYVNLEPCSHYGKKPPCALMIIQQKIPRVVIGHNDPFPKVQGGGIRMLRNAGVEVITDVLYDECDELNKRFFTFHEQKRPFVLLKWAESADGFIDTKRTSVDEKRVIFSTDETMKLSLLLRAQESAILIGTNTALLDNPSLTARIDGCYNPVRIVIDKELAIPENYNIFNKEGQTVVFTAKDAISHNNIKYVQAKFNEPLLPQIMSELYREQLLSVIVEGGRKLLESFIKAGLWDEARIETASDVSIKDGISAPKLTDANMFTEKKYGNNYIRFYKRIKK